MKISTSEKVFLIGAITLSFLIYHSRLFPLNVENTIVNYVQLLCFLIVFLQIYSLSMLFMHALKTKDYGCFFIKKVMFILFWIFLAVFIFIFSERFYEWLTK